MMDNKDYLLEMVIKLVCNTYNDQELGAKIRTIFTPIALKHENEKQTKLNF